MEIKKVFSLCLGLLGMVLIFISLIFMQTLTGAVLGVNVTSKFLGVLGVLFMIIAVFIERHNFEKFEKSEKENTGKHPRKKK